MKPAISSCSGIRKKVTYTGKCTQESYLSLLPFWVCWDPGWHTAGFPRVTPGELDTGGREGSSGGSSTQI